MSDHHHGAAVCTDLAQCALNGRFTVGGIGLRSRLVQDDDRRVLKDGAGDRQALLLPTRQLTARTTTDLGVVPVWQSHDHVMNLRPLRRCLHFQIRCIWSAEPNVLAHGVPQEHDILEDDRHRFQDFATGLIS